MPWTAIKVEKCVVRSQRALTNSTLLPVTTISCVESDFTAVLLPENKQNDKNCILQQLVMIVLDTSMRMES